ncbi:MAG: O-antigen ligase family protein [Spirulina sp. SIO3F2]|nr:O-antigen ligase family protein [Spirulina sp. SIO3F2]
MSDPLPQYFQPTITKIRRWSAERDHWAMVLVTGIYIFSILIHFNIPTTDLGMYNLAIPLLSLGILVLYRDLLWDVWQHHRRTLLLTIALYLWLWVSAFFGEHTSTAIKYTIKYSIYFFVFPALLTLSFKFVRDRKSDWIYRFFWILTLITAGFGIVDYLYPQFPLLIWIREPNFHVGFRILSFFDNPNKLGIMMAFGVINSYTIGKAEILRRPIVTALSIFVCGVIGILSGSRNFLIAVTLTLVVGIYPWRVVNKREVIMILIVGVMLSAILLSTNSTIELRVMETAQDMPHNWSLIQKMLLGDEEIINASSTPERLRIWYVASQEFWKNPLIGTGLAGFTNDIMGHRNAHNLMLTLLVEIGIPGTLLFFGILTSALWRTHLNDPRVGFFCSFIFTAQLLDFFIHDFTAMITMIWMIAIASHITKVQERSCIT